MRFSIYMIYYYLLERKGKLDTLYGRKIMRVDKGDQWWPIENWMEEKDVQLLSKYGMFK